MSFPFSPRLQDIKIESLRTQLDHLNLLRLRHQQWMSSADDPEIEAMHSDIAERLEQITAQYKGLLDALHR